MQRLREVRQARVALALFVGGCSSAPSTLSESRSQPITLEELAAVPPVQTPFVDDFTGATPGLSDGAGVSTGFSFVLPRADGAGSLPQNVAVDSSASELVLTTTAGIAQNGADAQDNALGVGIDLPNGTFRVETTILAPPAGSGNYEQAGLWFGPSQRDQLKLVVMSSPQGPMLQAGIEEGNVARNAVSRPIVLPADSVRLSLDIDPTLRQVRAFATLGAAGSEQVVAIVSDIAPSWFGLPDAGQAASASAQRAFAGIFATHRNRPAELGPLDYGFARFSVNKRIGLPSEPDVSGARWTSAPAFPGVTFVNPTGFAEAPGTGYLFVLEREGRVVAVPKQAPFDKRLVLDISSVTQGNQDLGLLGIAFHPQFGQRSSPNGRYMYLHYAHVDVPAPVPVPLDYLTESRLSRFEVDLDTLTVDPSSEQVLIAQSDEQLWHQGGGMYFDADDGFLYLSVGDEGDSNCVLSNCQRIDKDLFSGVLRIDVDQRGGDVSHPIPRQPLSGTTANYFIPNDNPFVGQPGVLEEFFAIGLRSPHRMTYDALDDIAWIGDVGQSTHEELDVLRAGANFQWDFREGLATHEPMSEMPLGVWTDPVLELQRSESVAVIGGYVYRGARFPELYGKYIFGDFFFGSIWAVDYQFDGSVATLLDRQRLLTTLLGKAGTISSFGMDLSGELYILVMGTQAEVQRLERGNATDALPPLLSRSGVFEDTTTLEPNAALSSYTVLNPLWSDGAYKRRWLQLPEGGKIGFAPEGAWHFPEGTVFVKHFEMALDERQPEQRKRLETRLLVAARGGRYYGITYKWNAAGTDAEPLLESQEEELDITQADGSVRQQTYYYPGPSDCLLCHNADAGYVLGVRTAQLNGRNTDGDASAPQLSQWAARGWFDTPLTDAEIKELPRLTPLSDETRPLGERVRSYWDSNCSMCHGSVGSIRATWDARFQTPLDRQGVLYGSLSGEGELPAGSFVVTPGDLEHSAMWQRALSTDPALRMPPLGRRRADPQYLDVLQRWISSL
jgi:uncharacterized repeat protein (TIGR03806 family)